MIYCDNAATTKMDPRVFESMSPYFMEEFYNPSSVYSKGKSIKNAIESARVKIANYLNCQADEIIFTGSGTEADNLAIKGCTLALMKKGKHLITSEIEHHAVLNSFKWLEKWGFEVTVLPVNQNFQVCVEDFKAAIREDTVLASIMLVNNEIGTLQPIKELVQVAHENGIVFHTDAVQALPVLPLDVINLGVDLLSISGHKIHGPKGIGVLYLKNGIAIEPLISGGQQENYKRSGTENVPGIIGFEKACDILSKERQDIFDKLLKRRTEFIEEIKKIKEVRINGEKTSVPSIISVSFKNINAEILLLLLMKDQIFASMGSACDSKKLGASHVLQAGKVADQYINGTIRFSFGSEITKDEILIIINSIKKNIKKIEKF